MKINNKIAHILKILIIGVIGVQTFTACEEKTANKPAASPEQTAEQAPEPANAEQAPKPSEEKLLKYIPNGYNFKAEMVGDLNGDGINDYVFTILDAAIDSAVNAISNFEFRLGDADLGIMIFLSEGSDYKLALEMRQFFGYGVVYEQCELPLWPLVSIEKGNLYIFYYNGQQYLDRKYTFRYRNSEFELIGYDGGDTVGYSCDPNRSVNLLTKKQVTKNGSKEKWSNFTIKEPILMRKINNLGRFNINHYIKDNLKTIGMFTDTRDGKTYWTAKIGGNTWMAENMNYEPQTGKSYCYNDSDSYCDKYGRLYDKYAAEAACPEGWHLATRKEWQALANLAGGKLAGKKLKAKYGWGYGSGTDNFGFSALPGGDRFSDGSYGNGGSSNPVAGKSGTWWVGTEHCRVMSSVNDFLGESKLRFSDDYLSARCVKNNKQKDVSK